MKNIFNLAYWLLTISWGYYLLKTMTTDSFDLQLLYAVKTILYAGVMQFLMALEKIF